MSQLQLLTSPERLFFIPNRTAYPDGNCEFTRLLPARSGADILPFSHFTMNFTVQRRNGKPRGALYITGLVRVVDSFGLCFRIERNATERNLEVALVVCFVILFPDCGRFIRINLPPRAKPVPGITRNFRLTASFFDELATSIA